MDNAPSLNDWLAQLTECSKSFKAAGMALQELNSYALELGAYHIAAAAFDEPEPTPHGEAAKKFADAAEKAAEAARALAGKKKPNG